MVYFQNKPSQLYLSIGGVYKKEQIDKDNIRIIEKEHLHGFIISDNLFYMYPVMEQSHHIIIFNLKKTEKGFFYIFNNKIDEFYVHKIKLYMIIDESNYTDVFSTDDEGVKLLRDYVDKNCKVLNDDNIFILKPNTNTKLFHISGTDFLKLFSEDLVKEI